MHVYPKEATFDEFGHLFSFFHHVAVGAPQKRRIRAKIAPQPPKISTPKSHRPQIYIFRRAVRENGARNVVGNEHEQRVGTDHFLHACRKLVLLFPGHLMNPCFGSA